MLTRLSMTVADVTSVHSFASIWAPIFFKLSPEHQFPEILEEDAIDAALPMVEARGHQELKSSLLRAIALLCFSPKEGAMCYPQRRYLLLVFCVCVIFQNLESLL